MNEPIMNNPHSLQTHGNLPPPPHLMALIMGGGGAQDTLGLRPHMVFSSFSFSFSSSSRSVH